MLVLQKNIQEVSWQHITKYNDWYSITDYTVEIQNYTVKFTHINKPATIKFKLKV